MANIKSAELILNESKMSLVQCVDFEDGSTLESLMNSLIQSMENKKIPCDGEYILLQTGNIFNKTTDQACFLYHPDHRDDYYNYVFGFKQQGNIGRLFIYRAGNSKQISKENFNQEMKSVSGTGIIGILAKTGSLAARGINAIGKDKGKLQEEQLYYQAFEQNVIETFQIRDK